MKTKVTVARKTLRSFLANRGILQEFIDAVIAENGIEDAKIRLSSQSADINNCLYWSNSKQGHNYWSNHNNDWCNTDISSEKPARIAGYLPLKTTGGFGLGCRRFKYSDVILLAKTWREACSFCSKTVTLSNGWEVKVRKSGFTITSYGDQFFTPAEFNNALRLYKLKLLEI